MKKILILLAIFTTVAATAQSVAINTDGSTADPSAILDLKSTTKGLLPPRMNRTERLAISAVEGLIVFQTDGVKGLYIFKNGDWVESIGATEAKANITYVDAQDLTKVDKETGKSLIADTEITRLASVTNSATIADESITSAKITDGTIANADISSSAGIAQSKIAGLTDDLAGKAAYITPGTAGNVLTSNGTDWVSQASAGSTITVGSIGTSSDANGATITSGVLSLTPADATNGGVVTTAPQTFAGAKTFTGQTVTVTNDIQAKRFVLTAPTPITAATTTTIDLSSGNVLTVSLGTNTTLTLTNAAVGTYLIKFVQDAIGGRTVTFPTTNWKWSGGTAPIITASGAKTDIVTLVYDGTTYYAAISQNF